MLKSANRIVRMGLVMNELDQAIHFFKGKEMLTMVYLGRKLRSEPGRMARQHGAVKLEWLQKVHSGVYGDIAAVEDRETVTTANRNTLR